MDVRRTWLSWARSYSQPVRWYFLVGYQEGVMDDVEREREQFGDVLIFADIPESYSNLVKKTTSFYRFLYEEKLARKLNFEYVLKSDDDCFVRLDTVLTELEVLLFPSLLHSLSLYTSLSFSLLLSISLSLSRSLSLSSQHSLSLPAFTLTLFHHSLPLFPSITLALFLFVSSSPSLSLSLSHHLPSLH